MSGFTPRPFGLRLSSHQSGSGKKGVPIACPGVRQSPAMGLVRRCFGDPSKLSKRPEWCRQPRAVQQEKETGLLPSPMMGLRGDWTGLPNPRLGVGVPHDPFPAYTPSPHSFVSLMPRPFCPCLTTSGWDPELSCGTTPWNSCLSVCLCLSVRLSSQASCVIALHPVSSAPVLTGYHLSGSPSLRLLSPHCPPIPCHHPLPPGPQQCHRGGPPACLLACLLAHHPVAPHRWALNPEDSAGPPLPSHPPTRS